MGNYSNFSGPLGNIFELDRKIENTKWWKFSEKRQLREKLWKFRMDYFEEAMKSIGFKVEVY